MQGKFEGAKQFGKMFSARVDGNNIGFGPADPAELGIEEGDIIKFDTTKRGQYTNADIKTIEIVEKAGAAKTGGTPNTSNSMNKGDYWEQKAEADRERQTIIEHQSSRNAAISMVDVLIKNGLVKLPAQAKQEDFSLALVESITARFNTELENVRQFGLPTNEEEVQAQNGDEFDE